MPLTTTSEILPDSAERDLIAALQAGHRPAWAEAMRRHGGAMLAAVRCITPSQAEDITQDAWLAAFQHIRGFEGRSSLKTWLVRIAVNGAYSWLRKAGREVSLESMDPGHDPLADAFSSDGHWREKFLPWTDDSPEALLQAHVLIECLEHHLDDLPESQRLALVLTDLSGLRPQEVTDTLGVEATHYRVLLHRARMRIFTMIGHYEQTGDC